MLPFLQIQYFIDHYNIESSRIQWKGITSCLIFPIIRSMIFEGKISLIEIWEIGPSHFYRAVFVWTLKLPSKKLGFYFIILIGSMEWPSSVDIWFSDSYLTVDYLPEGVLFRMIIWHRFLLDSRVLRIRRTHFAPQMHCQKSHTLQNSPMFLHILCINFRDLNIRENWMN